MTDIIEPENQKPTLRDVGKNVAFIVIAVGLAYWITVRIGIDDIRASIEGWGVFAPLLVIALKATSLVVVPIGGTPIYAVAGAIWGFWQGLFITLIGDFIGATMAFYISRFFGASVLHFFMSKQHLPMIEKIIARAAEPKLFWKARVAFAGFPELFAYASGLTKVSYPLFITAYMTVHAVGAALLVVFGQLLVTGNLKVMISVAVVSIFLAGAGMWWFNADLEKAS